MLVFFRMRRLLWICVTILFLFVAIFAVTAWTQSQTGSDGGLISLVRPILLETALAEDNAAAAFIDSEAGIAAYFQAPDPINLASVRSLYRTIEAETDTYLIGSIAVPNYASESEDVHVYVHVDGWVLAYYLASTPTANIIDWPRFSGTTIVTKFDTIFQLIAAQLGFAPPAATYYDFRFPNANYLLLVAETTSSSDTFTVFLNEVITYYERSWSLSARAYRGQYYLNNTQIGEINGSTNLDIWEDMGGTFTALQLPVNTSHTIMVEGQSGGGPYYGGLALVYRRN